MMGWLHDSELDQIAHHTAVPKKLVSDEQLIQMAAELLEYRRVLATFAKLLRLQEDAEAKL